MISIAPTIAAVLVGVMLGVLALAVRNLTVQVSRYMNYLESPVPMPSFEKLSPLVQMPAAEPPLNEPESFQGIPLAASLETDRMRAWNQGEEANDE